MTKRTKKQLEQIEALRLRLYGLAVEAGADPEILNGPELDVVTALGNAYNLCSFLSSVHMGFVFELDFPHGDYTGTFPLRFYSLDELKSLQNYAEFLYDEGARA